jgi:hypothetical protein
MLAPKNKHESTNYFARGLYGNSIRQWSNWREAIMEHDGPFVIRYLSDSGAQGKTQVTMIASGSSWSHLKSDVVPTVERLQGCPPRPIGSTEFIKKRNEFGMFSK